MFDVLIESKRKSEKKKALGVGAISLMLHTVIITGAIVATLTAGPSESGTKVDTTPLVTVIESDWAMPGKPSVVTFWLS